MQKPQTNLNSSRIEAMAFHIESLPALKPQEVQGYRIYRSPVQQMFFNIAAVDADDNLLVVVASDLNLDEAQELVSILNLEFATRESNARN